MHPLPPRWRSVAAATGLLDPSGTVRSTVFAEMSALAARTGAINLGQGFPDVDGPASVARAAADAIAAGANQYPPGTGIPACAPRWWTTSAGTTGWCRTWTPRCW